MKHLRYLSGVCVSPNGKTAAYVCTKGDVESGLFAGRIYAADLISEKTAPLTGEHGNCTQPGFFSDDELVYIAEKNGEAQLFKHNLNSGEVRQLTTARHGVNRYALSGDGKAAVLELNVWKEDIRENRVFREMSEAERAAWNEELEYRPYEITDLTYKMDEWKGMCRGELPQIAVLDLECGTQRLVLREEMESIYPALSGDGKQIAFYGFPHKGALGRQPELFICGADGGDLKQMTDNVGVYANMFPLFTADGEEVIYTAFPAFEDGSSILLPFAANLRTGELRAIMAEDDDTVCHGLNPFPTNRTEYGINGPYCRLSGDELVFVSGFKGRGILCTVKVDGSGRAELLREGDTDIQAFDIAGEGTLVYLMSTLRTPAELYLKRPGGDEKRLTDANPWLAEYELPETEEFWIPSKDGKAELQVWLLHPAGQTEGRLYPAVLYIHGGPECMYNASYWHEFHALAAAGMAVIYTNPRGSVGYGRAFCAGGIAWKQEAMEDLESAVEACTARGFIDRKRIGATGGSYGGYMVNYMAAHCKRFKAYVTQRSVSNELITYASSDMQGCSRPYKSFEDFLIDKLKNSTVSYAEKIDRPFLILHGTEDLRVPVENAHQLFVAIKDTHLELPVKMALYPHTAHGQPELPSQRRHYYGQLLDWFVKYL